MTVLIVDDDVDDLDFFTEAVDELNEGITCIRAHNGIEAIKLLDEGEVRPHYIFLDLNMPKMDGKKCLQLLKKSPVFQSIPVIIYSTGDRPEDKEEVARLGATSYLIKPTTFDQLKNEIRAVLYSRSA